MTNPRWVIDTNVLISAALSSKGIPAKLVRYCLENGALVFSSATFDELRTRLYKSKFDPYISIEFRNQSLHDFNASAVWVETGKVGKYCRDRDDDVFIETALQSKADLLISGDQDLLTAKSVKLVRIVSPAQATKLLGLSP